MHPRFLSFTYARPYENFVFHILPAIRWFHPITSPSYRGGQTTRIACLKNVTRLLDTLLVMSSVIAPYCPGRVTWRYTSSSKDSLDVLFFLLLIPTKPQTERERESCGCCLLQGSGNRVAEDGLVRLKKENSCSPRLKNSARVILRKG